MEKKQTAVDLMFKRAISVLPMGSIDARRKLAETYLEAKQIEKEQMIEFAENYMWEHYIHKYEDRITCDQTAMEFYNETYGEIKNKH